MTEQIIIADAYDETSCEKFPCLKCGRQINLWYNGGELDRSICCDITYEGRAKGFEVVAIVT